MMMKMTSMMTKIIDDEDNNNDNDDVDAYDDNLYGISQRHLTLDIIKFSLLSNCLVKRSMTLRKRICRDSKLALPIFDSKRFYDLTKFSFS